MTDSTVTPGSADASERTAQSRRADAAALVSHIEEQERRLVFDGFDNDDALELGAILLDLARSRVLPVTVDITRGDQQLFHAALPGTAAHNDVWIRRKVATVRELGISSFLAGRRAAAEGHVFEEAPWIDPRRLAGHGGAFPITVAGVGVVGTVTVSGLPQDEDHALAVEAIERFLAR